MDLGTVSAEPLPSRRFSDRHLVVLLLAICAVPMLLLAYYRLHTAGPSGDEPHYLVISQALAKHHSLDVMQVYHNKEYLPFYKGPLTGEDHTAPGPHGPLPKHGIGGPLLWFVPFMLWGLRGEMIFMVIVSLLTVANIFWLLRQLGVDKAYSFGTGLLFGLGSTIFTYAPMAFVESIGALVFGYVLRVLHRREMRPADLVLASIGIGALPWVQTRFDILAPLFLSFLAWRIFREDRLTKYMRYVYCLLPAAVLGLAYEAYNVVVWHSWDPTINQQVGGNASLFQTAPWRGLVGTAFDQVHGVVPNYPIFLFVLPGLLLMLSRRYALLHLHILVPFGIYTVLVFTAPEWWGGFAPPARFVVAVLPLLAPYVAVALQRTHNALVTAFAAGGVVITLGITTLAQFTTDHGFSSPSPYYEALTLFSEKTGRHVYKYVPAVDAAGNGGVLRNWVLGAVAFTMVVWVLGWRPWEPRLSLGRNGHADVMNATRTPRNQALALPRPRPVQVDNAARGRE